MASLQIGKYKDPKIYQEEYDNSVVGSPTVTGITNLVIGVAKNGPINSPVLISNTTDLKNIFGGIDRTLERKSSFFQRTIAQMIQSSPVWGFNILETDDTLDTLQYAPLSTSTNNSNDIIRTGPYSKFFNTTGFWRLDADYFLTLAANNPDYTERLLNLTNTSSGYITVFVFKTTATGFDVTMLNWYGTIQNMPTYVYPTDYASDYMVDVVVVAGDYSNYAALSVDPVFSKYFDTTGLIKTQVNNFINNANVVLLKYYEGLSLIPYFKDTNNNNIFIETIINKDTSRTGLFCAFNIDAFETDYPNGMVDIIGNNLVADNNLIDVGVNTIDFLSYNDKTTESIQYVNTILDTPGNVIAMDFIGAFTSNILGNTHRTGWYAEDIIVNVSLTAPSYTSGTASVGFIFGSSSNGVDSSPYSVVGGTQIFVPASSVAGMTLSFDISSGLFPTFAITQSNYVAFKMDTTGNISYVTSPNVCPSVDPTDLVLGYMNLTTYNGLYVAASCSYTAIYVRSTGYIDLLPDMDYTITSLGVNNTFTVTFLDTAAAPSTSRYAQYRRIKRFNDYRNILESVNVNKAVILMDFMDTNGYVKVSLANMIISTVTSTTQDKSFTIQTNLGLSETDFSNVVYNMPKSFVMYVVDNEQIFSNNEMITTNTISSTGSYGIVAKYSNMYQDFFDGRINTGDYIYNDICNQTLTTMSFLSASGSNYIVMSGTAGPVPFNADRYDTISVPSSVLNVGSITIESSTNWAYSVFGLDITFNWAYKINYAVTREVLTNVDTIFDASTKYYLSMYSGTSSNLNIRITDNSLSTQQLDLNMPNAIGLDTVFNVTSNISNYQESVEIVVPANYVPVTNKVLVNAVRYSNVVVGDFLEAYVDETQLVAGQVAKRLTRIITKKVYSGDTTLAEITCDGAINKYLIGGNYQTMRYSSLDKYVTTYKAIPLKGFRIRQDSMPDGTDTRLTQILNVIAAGTPLFKALTNKDAIQFRYLVDSFGLGLTERSKQQLADICGARLDCLGFINMPSMKQFTKSSSPSFVDANGVLQTSYIASGGNITNNPAFLYTMADGETYPSTPTCVGYFCPWLATNDNGRRIFVPPAMYVATTYMLKLNSNVTSTVPWTIAAGLGNGQIIGISGVEMDFTTGDGGDTANLNAAHFNPIIIKKNKGWIIDTENTALTLYTSALSYLHVREVLIELEDELAAMLLEFQWTFDTPDVRSQIKLKADGICQGYVAKNGLYNYSNQCDSVNNTQTLIDNQIGLLTTNIEPIMGLGSIVNQITVYKTGGLSSSGFQL
jgi:hypothetical protein